MSEQGKSSTSPDTAGVSATTGARGGERVVGPPWVACHDTLVCAGAKQIQKWCVREGDDKGPLIAVMLTKDVAHVFAAAPDMLAALQNLVADILDYERVNNLAPSPGKQDCWQSVTAARAAIAKAGPTHV